MTGPIDLHIGNRLRARRRQLDLTLQDVAAAAGLRFRQLQKYERAVSCTNPATLVRLARALDVEVAYFFEGLARVDGLLSRAAPEVRSFAAERAERRRAAGLGGVAGEFRRRTPPAVAPEALARAGR